MQHVQPLERSFPWRAVAIAVAAVALAELAGLLAFAGVRLYPHLHLSGLTHAAAAPTSPERTRPVTVTGRVSAGHVPPLRPRSHVSVLVLNGDGVTGAAGSEATRLLHRGYHAATAANAPSHDYAASLVLFRPGWQREARRLAHDAGVKLVSPLDGRLPAGSGRAQLVLVLGR